jgi:hypothetical protein
MALLLLTDIESAHAGRMLNEAEVLMRIIDEVKNKK